MEFGEHLEIFATVTDIYTSAKLVHNISGHIPVILAEDKPKCVTEFFMNQNGTLRLDFVGCDQIWVSDFKLVVGFGEKEYNKILDFLESWGTTRWTTSLELLLSIHCMINCLD